MSKSASSVIKEMEKVIDENQSFVSKWGIYLRVQQAQQKYRYLRWRDNKGRTLKWPDDFLHLDFTPDEASALNAIQRTMSELNEAYSAANRASPKPTVMLTGRKKI